MYLKTVTSTTPTKGTSKLKEPYVSKDCHKNNTNRAIKGCGVDVEKSTLIIKYNLKMYPNSQI